MKALVYYGPMNARVEEVPVPAINDDEVLVKVHSCSICGTDLRTYKSGHTRIKGRRIIGHEFSGTIAKVGANVTGYAEGEAVMVVPGIACGKCELCQHGLQNLCQNRVIIGFDFDGAFAEYVRIPAAAVAGGNIKRLPKGVSLTVASLVEPFAAVYNGQQQLNIQPGDRVGVIGAGPVGIMHMMQARARGAAMVGMIDLNGERLKEVAEQFHPEFVIDSSKQDPVEEVRKLTGLGLDVVIVAAAAAPAQRQALELARLGGRVSFFAGLPHSKPDALLNTNLIHYKQLSVHGANGSGANQYDTVLRWIGSGAMDLESLVTHELPLDRVIEGIEMKMAGLGLKIVVHPGE